MGLLMRERRAGLHTGRGMPGAFLLGVTFAAGWTPCIGPQLTAILAVAAQHDFGGLPVMLVYCLGLAMPFLLSAALADRLQGTIRAVNRHMGVVTRVAGVLLLVMGAADDQPADQHQWGCTAVPSQPVRRVRLGQGTQPSRAPSKRARPTATASGMASTVPVISGRCSRYECALSADSKKLM